MRTNVPDIFSAGDVTSFPLTIRGDQRVNIGHWQMSQAQGKTLIQRNAAQYCVCWLHVADHAPFFFFTFSSQWVLWVKII